MQKCIMQCSFSGRKLSGKKVCAIRSLGNVWKNELYFNKMKNLCKTMVFCVFILNAKHSASPS